MKVILSRKGFDSSYGGIPSPIFRHPDGSLSLHSLPIPSTPANIGYEDIRWSGGNLQDLVSSLRCRHKARLPNTPHLDPDLVRDSLDDRHAEWRPIYGQSGNAETQLTNEGVHNPSDLKNRPLFLFFGWFRETRKTPYGYSYVRDSPDVHALFGWLQVEQKIAVTDHSRIASEMPWTASHPHVVREDNNRVANSIYVAPKPGAGTDRLILGGRDTQLPASGVFSRFDPEIHVLTKKGRTRSHWILPSWFYRGGDPRLGMHTKLSCWTPTPNSEMVELQSVGRGQEFVFESTEHDEPSVFDWVERIVRAGQPSSMPVSGQEVIGAANIG